MTIMQNNPSQHSTSYKLSELYTSQQPIEKDGKQSLMDRVNRFARAKYGTSVPSIKTLQPDDKLLLAIYDGLMLALPEMERKNATFDECLDKFKTKECGLMVDAYAEFAKLVKARVKHMLNVINHPARIKAIKGLHAKGLCKNIKLPQQTT